MESIVSTTGPRVTKTSLPPKTQHPEKSQGNKSSWVTIARKAAKLSDPPVASISWKYTQQTNNSHQDTRKEDKRLFLRLGEGHEWRKLSPVTVRIIVADQAGVVISAIASIY
ncbi:putative eka-like protein [Erysiphe necator]|uniref:Putative eka-like protein n=1 Tax=Uncinula necator TaxID=52586 RepID=A0A0B1PEG8_UNCNE|nr:putative eka-like protein [Erysiphe necator]